MLTDNFFNKTRFSVVKLTDQVEIAPNTAFSLPTTILDTLSFKAPTTVTAVLQKVIGRATTTLPTVVTVTGTYIFSATPATLDWDGTTTLQMKITIDTVNTIILPLIIKG